MMLLDGDWASNRPDRASFGMKVQKTRSTVRTLKFGKANLVMPSSVTLSETEQIQMQLEQQYKRVSLDESITESAEDVWQVKGSEHCYIAMTTLFDDEDLHEHDGKVVTLPDTEVQVRASVKVGNYSSRFALTIDVIWETDSVKRAAAIKTHLTDIPEAFIATAQAAFTAACAANGVDVNAPTFDCEFTANIETVSKCEPDIIKQMEKARLERL